MKQHLMKVTDINGTDFGLKRIISMHWHPYDRSLTTIVIDFMAMGSEDGFMALQNNGEEFVDRNQRIYGEVVYQ